jgi:hypothetical protein
VSEDTKYYEVFLKQSIAHATPSARSGLVAAISKQHAVDRIVGDSLIHFEYVDVHEISKEEYERRTYVSPEELVHRRQMDKIIAICTTIVFCTFFIGLFSFMIFG